MEKNNNDIMIPAIVIIGFCIFFGKCMAEQNRVGNNYENAKHYSANEGRTK